MAKDSSDILSRVSHLEQGDSSRDIYDDWSKDYDAHLMADFGYISPRIAAESLSAEIERRDIDIIDFGCGTGLVGEALSKINYQNIDGIDISEGMLAQARSKQVYRHLMCGDLTQTVALQDASYGAGLCIGSMGAGHVGAQHVPELIRPISAGGIFVIIMNGMYYSTGGFEKAFRQLESDGLWEIRKLEEFNYMTELDRPGWLLVAEKL